MSRRLKKALFEEIAEEFEQLPFSAGLVAVVLLAAVGWALPVLLPMQGLSIAGSLAVVGRYLVWILALMVGLSSVYGAVRRQFERRRFDSPAAVSDLTWSQFEGYLAEYFRRRGYDVRSRGGAVADGGVDLVLENPSGRTVVQAKHWKTRKVGVVPIRALWGVLGDEAAQGAIFVTSGSFTADAAEFAEGKHLELIDGERLRAMIAEVKGRGEPATVTAPAQETCPQCGRGVLERKLARRGARAGSYFDGCSRYPRCRYLRNAS